MSWIAEKIKEENALKAKQALIVSQAHNFFNQVWNEILVLLAEAKENGRQVHSSLDSSASPRGRLAYTPQGASNPRKLAVSLDMDLRQIAVETTSGTRYRLNLDAQNGRVLAVQEGKPLSVEDTAKLNTRTVSVSPSHLAPIGHQQGTEPIRCLSFHVVVDDLGLL